MKQSKTKNHYIVIYTRISIFLAIIGLSSCASIESSSPVQIIADAHLQTVNTIDVYSENDTIHALFSGIDTVSQQLTLKYLRSTNHGESWSSPVIVNRNIALVKKSKRGNDFQIAAFREHIMAIWQTKGGEPWTGKIAAALSNDNGKTWNKIPSPVSDIYSKIDQGYFDLTADPAGNFHINWLDDREEAGDTQGLRYAQFQKNTNTWTLHKDIELTACTCCWSNITADKKGNIHTLFRDDSPRDMKIISSLDNGKSWQTPNTVENFDWQFVGCPHQGGGIATTQENDQTIIHSLVWNGKNSNRGLYYSQSVLSAKKSQAIISMGDNTSASGDIAVSNNNRIATTYITGNFGNKRVIARISNDGGKSWSGEQQLTIKGAEPSHPRIVGTSQGFSVFWTEWQENGNAAVIMSTLK